MGKKFNPSTLLKAKATSRKPKPRMTYKLLLRFTQEQHEKIEADAKSLGQRKTAFCRSRILGYKPRDRSPAHEALRRAVIANANNINQIAHHMNTYGVSKDTLAEVEEMLIWFRQIKSLINNE